MAQDGNRTKFRAYAQEVYASTEAYLSNAPAGEEGVPVLTGPRDNPSRCDNGSCCDPKVAIRYPFT